MKKLKQVRFLIYIGIFLLLGNSYVSRIKAAPVNPDWDTTTEKGPNCDLYQCITCTYAVDGWKIQYNVQADGTGGQVFESSNVTILEDSDKHPRNSGAAPIRRVSTLTPTNFYSSAQQRLVCPPELYVVKNISDYSFTSKGKKNSETLKLVGAESTDNNKGYRSSSFHDEVKLCTVKEKNSTTNRSCELKIVKNDVEVMSCDPSAEVTLDSTITASIFKNSCGSKLHLECNQFAPKCTLRYGNSAMDDIAGTQGVDGEETKNYEKFVDEVMTTKPEVVIGNLSCEDLSQLTSFANKIYRWIVIFMVVGLVILTMFEYMSAVVNADDDKRKKANKHLVTRFIILIIMFLLPLLITMILDAFVPNITTCLNF